MKYLGKKEERQDLVNKGYVDDIAEELKEESLDANDLEEVTNEEILDMWNKRMNEGSDSEVESDGD